MAQKNSTSATSTELPHEVRVLVVTAPAGPRRRAGFAFGPVAVDLTEEQLGDKPDEIVETLRADPFLKIDIAFRQASAEPTPDA